MSLASPIAEKTLPLSMMHSVCRGEFIALVFSGARQIIGELPGEATAHTLYKFAWPDPRLEADEDFASTPGMPLPYWSADRLQPIDGVCFVFADREHPDLRRLQEAGAVENEHYVTLDSDQQQLEHDDLERRLGAFVERITSSDGAIAVLGFGHQGSAIAAHLRDTFAIKPQRILICDSNDESIAKAKAEGFAAVELEHVLHAASSIVYSPLMHHQRLYQVALEASARGLAVFDNSRRSSGLQQFVAQGNVRLDAAANRALHVEGNQLTAKPHGLMLQGVIIRDDRRRLGGVTFPHLHGGHRFQFSDDRTSLDLQTMSRVDPLAPETFIAMNRIYVSVRDRADHGYFAARDFCMQLWPEATRDVFPSAHEVDLGQTAFERLLVGHMHGREVVSTMQTPLQRATLGIVARHYASDRPIIEIGSAFGGSALLLAAATDATRTLIHSIDPETSTRDIMRFAFQREGWLDRLKQHVQTSDEAAETLADRCRGQAGLVFIDGLHTEAGVRSDFEQYAAMVAPGGALVFHDVAPQIYSVLRVIVEHVLPDPRFQIKCLVDGLAVFERRRD